MPVTITRTVDDIRREVRTLRLAGKRIAFVPTMGALHEGHTALMRKAGGHADVVIASIFVNPTQFGPNEDFSRYPRTLDADVEMCEQNGVSLVFSPDVSQIYDADSFIKIQVSQLGDHLCGRTRPGHFNGVVQIVNKLFNIVKPDVAVFGQKDIQQLRIIRQMVHEFNHDIEIVMGETIRATDGLALSSRNRYLTTDERAKVPLFYQTLKACQTAITNGRAIATVLDEAKTTLETAGLRVDYLECVNNHDLQPATLTQPGKTYIIAGAVFVSATRLIDNVIVEG